MLSLDTWPGRPRYWLLSTAHASATSYHSKSLPLTQAYITALTTALQSCADHWTPNFCPDQYSTPTYCLNPQYTFHTAVVTTDKLHSTALTLNTPYFMEHSTLLQNYSNHLNEHCELGLLLTFVQTMNMGTSFQDCIALKWSVLHFINLFFFGLSFFFVFLCFSGKSNIQCLKGTEMWRVLPIHFRRLAVRWEIIPSSSFH